MMQHSLQERPSIPAAPSAPRPVPGASSHATSATPGAASSAQSLSEEALQRRRSLVWGPIVRIMFHEQGQMPAFQMRTSAPVQFHFASSPQFSPHQQR